MSGALWRQRYDALARQLPALARDARPVLCGMGACVDACLRLHEATPLLGAAAGTPARALADELLRRAAAGIGGEIRVEWSDGPAWLDAHLPLRLGLGGTGAQAAQTLAVIGAPAVLALGDRSARQLGLIDPRVRLLGADGPMPANAVHPQGTGKPAHYIVEFTAGIPAAGIVPPRSSRVIVRFADDPLERDPWFEALSPRLAATAGAAIVSGFNELPDGDLPGALAVVATLVRSWREAGLACVHLELGDYPQVSQMHEVLAGLGGVVTSLGLSRSELEKLQRGQAPVVVRAVALAERHGLDRVVVHADHWALAVGGGEPERELLALLTGSLLAATRASHGRIAVPAGLPPGAILAEPPAPPLGRQGGWPVACCATPYLPQPAATIGLGDTFLAGCLLALSRQ